MYVKFDLIYYRISIKKKKTQMYILDAKSQYCMLLSDMCQIMKTSLTFYIFGFILFFWLCVERDVIKDF